MFEMPDIKERLRQYNFEWMTNAPGQYRQALVCEFYVAYQMEIKRRYPKGDYGRIVIIGGYYDQRCSGEQIYTDIFQISSWDRVSAADQYHQN